jgi:hypothetical protein
MKYNAYTATRLFTSVIENTRMSDFILGHVKRTMPKGDVFQRDGLAMMARASRDGKVLDAMLATMPRA